MSDHLPPAPPELTLTGERTLPGIPDERYWFQRHVVAYDLAAVGIAGADVLDAGCGEGYGLRRLADAGAAACTGVDLDRAVVSHVAATYARDAHISVHAADLGELPLATDSIDRAVSLQVIEHLYDIPAYLAELRRVVRPDGDVWIATPNRLTFTPGSDTPVNPFHVREFTAEELTTTLTAAGFEVTAVHGVHHGRALRVVERLLRRPLVEALTSAPPSRWPRWLRRTVHRVEPTWFDVRDDDLDASLDLVAVARPVSR